MQFVSKKTLEELARKTSTLSEAEQSVSYDEIAKQWSNMHKHVYKSFESRHQSLIEDEILKETYNEMYDVMKSYHPPIRYVGQGSSRCAYACDGGKCIKGVMNARGVKQNKVEVRNTYNSGNSPKYSCFAQIYGHDSDYFTILTECCAEAKETDLQKAFHDILHATSYGICLSQFFPLLRQLVNEFECNTAIAAAATNDVLKTIQPVRFASERAEEAEHLALLKLCEVVDLPKTPVHKMLSDLLKFYIDNGRCDEALLIDDLEAFENWGLAIRDGTIVPVIIDAGYDSEVMKDYYD